MFVRFNNDNIWEIVENNNGITCYKREYGKSIFKANIDSIINEDLLVPEGYNKFSYPDWKVFFGQDKLKKMAADLTKEQSALPLIYFVKYILGYPDDDKMTRILATRYRFDK